MANQLGFDEWIAEVERLLSGAAPDRPFTDFDSVILRRAYENGQWPGKVSASWPSFLRQDAPTGPVYSSPGIERKQPENWAWKLFFVLCAAILFYFVCAHFYVGMEANRAKAFLDDAAAKNQPEAGAPNR